MQRSNTADGAGGPGAPLGSDAATLDAIAAGALGFTVRCTPHRRTVLAQAPDGRRLFAKLRRGGQHDAAVEWQWLHVLPMLGVPVPAPVALVQLPGGRSLLCTEAAPGRPLDALLADARRAGRSDRAVAFACRVVAPLVRRLHDQGIVFRDLYWNHLFAADLDASTVVCLDVERVFRPRWRLSRWIVKDLAGLLASVPGELPPVRAQLAFLRAWLAGDRLDRRSRRRLARRVHRKARRIRAHAPRYG